MKYLIDTNIIVDHLRIGEEKATNFLKKIERGEISASISVITEYELLVSQKISSSQKVIIQKLLTLLPSISITSLIVQEAIKFSQKYQLGMADGLIASTAFKTRSILVTRDKIFSKLKEIKIEPLK
ncbi:PIN domain-containing protein [Patescibacteria group bacterium]|nr:PIN domain-containing protein [Patescibacteria group bacterium]